MAILPHGRRPMRRCCYLAIQDQSSLCRRVVDVDFAYPAEGFIKLGDNTIYHVRRRNAGGVPGIW